jgi:hypothetical protein
MWIRPFKMPSNTILGLRRSGEPLGKDAMRKAHMSKLEARLDCVGNVIEKADQGK